MSSEYLLTFEWNKELGRLEIHGDKKGIRKLINNLEEFLTIDKTEHTHLRTPSIAGEELTEEVQGEHGELIEDVVIYCWKE